MAKDYLYKAKQELMVEYELIDDKFIEDGEFGFALKTSSCPETLKVKGQGIILFDEDLGVYEQYCYGGFVTYLQLFLDLRSKVEVEDAKEYYEMLKEFASLIETAVEKLAKCDEIAYLRYLLKMVIDEDCLKFKGERLSKFTKDCYLKLIKLSAQFAVYSPKYKKLISTILAEGYAGVYGDEIKQIPLESLIKKYYKFLKEYYEKIFKITLTDEKFDSHFAKLEQEIILKSKTI